MPVSIFNNNSQHAGKQVLLHCKNFIKRLIIRKHMFALQYELEDKNELDRILKPISLIAIGLGGTIGEWDRNELMILK
jgi:hypothetical protein